jgi:hypothetical protein
MSSIFAPERQPVQVETGEPEAPATPPEAVMGEPLTEAQEMVDARVKRRRATPEAAIRDDARRRILQEMVNCPECGISLQLRCLAWRHTCAPEPDLREQLLKSAHDAFYKRRSAALAAQGA